MNVENTSSNAKRIANAASMAVITLFASHTLAQDFTVNGHAAFLLLPDTPANGSPWVWYAPTLSSIPLPGTEEGWMFDQFLDAGIAIAGIDVGESYGSPDGRSLFTDLYDELATNRGMSKKPCFLVRSRGGLMAYNWAAENPDKVSGIAGIYPVCNLQSYPGLATACGAYNMTEQELSACLTEHNPMDRLAPLAAANVPLYHLHGDIDTIVPLEDNSAVVAERYAQLGGEMTLDVKVGHGHDYWEGWFQDEGLTNFILQTATVPEPASAVILTMAIPAVMTGKGKRKNKN